MTLAAAVQSITAFSPSAFFTSSTIKTNPDNTVKQIKKEKPFYLQNGFSFFMRYVVRLLYVNLFFAAAGQVKLEADFKTKRIISVTAATRVILTAV